MDRKTFTIVMAVALLVSFFLPLFKVGGSAFDIVKMGGSWQNYLWLVFPICGVLLLVGELNSSYAANRGLITWLPLLTLLFILIIYPLIKKMPLGTDMIKAFGIGMWVTIVASLILALYNPRPR
jgi:hypothetical protein